MPYFGEPIHSVSTYLRNRVRLFKHTPTHVLFRNGYADEFYPLPLIHTEKEVAQLINIQKVIHKAVTCIVENYFKDTDIQKIIPLSKKVRNELRKLYCIPYKVGGIRPDYIYTKSGRPMICEINARFIFNGFFMSIYMNDIFKKVFPKYRKMKDLTSLSNTLKTYFKKKKVAIIKEREDGYDTHSFMLENPKAELFRIQDMKKVLRTYQTIVLELHQDELEKCLGNVSKSILQGKEILDDPRTIFIVHDKRILSVLSKTKIMKRYLSSKKDLKILETHVIPTYTMNRDKKTLANVALQKNHWVIKKAISGKAEGLYIGKEKTPTEWKQILKIKNVIFQPYIKQKEFVFWDPTKRAMNQWHLAGTLPMWNNESFGPGLYRVSHTHKHDFARFIQPLLET
jgi:hypothetical protein